MAGFIKWLDSITDSMDMRLSKLQEIVEDSPRGCKNSDVTSQLNDNNASLERRS